MRKPSSAAILMVLLCGLAVASSFVSIYIGVLGALVAITTLLSTRVLGGKMELRRWQPPAGTATVGRSGPLAVARKSVREAMSGNAYFRNQVADALLRAAATRDAGNPWSSRRQPLGARESLISSPRGTGAKGAAYLRELSLAMDAIER